MPAMQILPPTLSPARPRPIAALLAASALAGASLAPAHAGRPLATDDAAVTEPARCQIESWVERHRDQRAFVLGATCGLGGGFDAAIDRSQVRPRGDTSEEMGAALKWAAAEGLQTPLGTVTPGVRLGTTTVRQVAGGWHLSGAGALGILSLDAGNDIQLHLNLGPQRDRATRRTTTVALAALAWSPVREALWFAEVQANDRRAEAGGAVRTAGARWWLLHEKLGLDVSASRTAGSAGTTWMLGFGWYGIGLPGQP